MKYNVVILGAGPAGITAAVELGRAGLSVALVESGGLEFDPDVQALYDGVVTGHDAVDLAAIRLRMFGGTSNHWGGHCVPLDPIDFARAPLSGMSGWPFGYEHILPYYGRAQDYCDIGDFDYAWDVSNGTTPRDFLLPGHARLETSVLRQSAPTNFGDKYRPFLEGAPNVDLRFNQSAVDLVSDEAGAILSVELRSLDGVTERIEGEAIILACGAVETARLLMLSNARHGRRFGDAGELLGKCYMDHPAGGAAFLTFSQPQSSKVYWRSDLAAPDGTPLHHVWRLRDEVLAEEGLLNAQFYLIPFSDDPAIRRQRAEANRSVAALRSIAKWGIGREQEDFRLSDAYCSFITNADSFVEQTWANTVIGERVDRVLLKYEVEQLPARENAVSLSQERDALGLPRANLHWSPSLAERDTLVRTAIEIGRICGEEGLGRMELEDHFDARYWDASTSWHQMGTARMAVSPNNGVVDPDCRVHGTRNLFVAGGAVMPSVGRANPTLTIVALAIRLADHLKAEVRTL